MGLLLLLLLTSINNIIWAIMLLFLLLLLLTNISNMIWAIVLLLLLFLLTNIKNMIWAIMLCYSFSSYAFVSPSSTTPLPVPSLVAETLFPSTSHYTKTLLSTQWHACSFSFALFYFYFLCNLVVPSLFALESLIKFSHSKFHFSIQKFTLKLSWSWYLSFVHLLILNTFKDERLPPKKRKISNFQHLGFVPCNQAWTWI